MWVGLRAHVCVCARVHRCPGLSDTSLCELAARCPALSRLAIRGGYASDSALRALGITAAARFSGLPDVPTIAEAGIEGVISDTFYGVLAPAGVPAGRITALAAALRGALAEPDTRAALAGQGGNIIGSTPEDFAARLRISSARWAEVVQAGQIRME